MKSRCRELISPSLLIRATKWVIGKTADPVVATAMRQEAAIQRHDIIAIGNGGASVLKSEKPACQVAIPGIIPHMSLRRILPCFR